MHIDHLVTQNFRNSKFGVLNFKDGVNLLYGDNAAGKTNVLEAIYLFATCKSFRTSNENDFINKNSDFAEISIGFHDEILPDVSRRLMIRYRERGKKCVKLLRYDNTDVRRISDFIGNFRAVLFMPDNLSLVRGLPEERRRFVDMAIMQINSGYAKCLNSYLKILSQKNAYLKSVMNNSGFDAELLDVYNRKLSHAASVIVRQRAGFVEKLHESAKRIYSEISSDDQVFLIKYVTQIKSDPFDTTETEKAYYELYTQNRKSELNFGATLYGPHRDDITMKLVKNEEIQNERSPFDKVPIFDEKIYDFNVKSFGSQGQTRTAVLALKLAEGEILKDKTGEDPVYLFDDVFSELDGKRKKYLTQKLSSKQVIITCCSDEITRELSVSNKIRVENGEYYNE